ncbi:MAG TPA: caspase family protein [Chloroflexia bacterium]|nr:caspase family protein [Chloroflexia bacterium]
MAFWDSLNKLWNGDARVFTAVIVPAANVSSTSPDWKAPDSAPLVPEASYFRIWVEKMYLHSGRTGFQTWYPGVQSVVVCSFGNDGKAADLTMAQLAGPDQFKGIDASHLDRVVSLQTELTPLVPFKGGTVKLGVGLLRLEANNLLRSFLDVVGKLSALVKVPPLAGTLSGALTIASTVSNALEQLLGSVNRELVVGYQQTFESAGGGGTHNLRPGYIAILNEPAGKYRPEHFWVYDGDLLVWDVTASRWRPLVEVSGADYMLLRIEARTTRDDIEALSPMDELLTQAVNALQVPDLEKAETLLRGAQAAVQASPDLVKKDRFLLLNTLGETYAQYKKAMLGTGERGLESMFGSDQEAPTLPTWKELVQRAFAGDAGPSVESAPESSSVTAESQVSSPSATGIATDAAQELPGNVEWAAASPGTQATMPEVHHGATGGDTLSSDYHVLLIGIDNYSNPGKLSGCVNDIDVVEELLLRSGVGTPPERIHITRLAAPLEGAASSSHIESQPPTGENIRQALAALGDPARVKPMDRVLVYYAGHGSQVKWTTGSWHEALVPLDKQFIYDVELNPLLSKITSCTEDLTVVLDCCHSAGATRDVSDPDSTDRFLSAGDEPVEPPATLLETSKERSATSDSGALNNMDPRHMVIAACQADETAKETNYNGVKHGWFTYGFTSALMARGAEERGTLRWADVWPQMLDKLTKGGSSPQHPWLIGRSERRIFGGPWHPQDAGFAVTKDAQGVYHVNAGTLMGVTAGARLAVYGAEPAIFPTLNSAEDQQARKGLLEIVSANRSDSTARTVEPFELPSGARARIVKPGEKEQLQVALNPPDEDISAQLQASPILQIVPPGTPDADVRVAGSAQRGWTISNDIEPIIATVPPEQMLALRAGLEAYDSYARVIRFARKCNDVALNGALQVQLLDCRGIDPNMTFSDDLLDHLPEAPKRSDSSPYTGMSYGGNYVLPTGFPFAIKISNAKALTLHAKVLLCTAGGKVYYLGDTTVRAGTREVLWQQQTQGKPWLADPAMGRKEATDRLVVFATNKTGVDLSTLQWLYNVQQVVNGESDGMRDVGTSGANIPELWTAQIIPLIMTG